MKYICWHNFLGRVFRALPLLILTLAVRLHAGNPIVEGRGMTDPYAVVYGDRVYIYATHDCDSARKGFFMTNWWQWSSADLVNWQLDGMLQTEDTFIGHPFKDCWATCAISRNGKYYWYFSAGRNELGVVVADSPTGPWRDPLHKPLVPAGLTKTEQRDPNVLLAADGNAYLVFGTFNYFIVRLNEDMISLAEKPHPVDFDKRFGPYGAGKTDDKPSLHQRNGIYYLSWSSFYAMSTNIYGPYTYKGTVVDPALVAPDFRHQALFHDRHGNFFTWHNQWYYTCNDKSQPGRSDFFRDAIITYVHFKDNGEMAPVRIDRVGVGQYDARQPRIEAEDYFNAVQAEQRECPVGGFEVSGLRDGSALYYPKVMNLPADGRMTFSAAVGAGGGDIEVRAGDRGGDLLGTCHLDATGGWDKFQSFACPLKNPAGTQDLCLVFKGGDKESEFCRLDWFGITNSQP